MTPETVGITIAELGGACVVIVGAMWTLGKIAMGQHEARIGEKFAGINDHLLKVETLTTGLAAVNVDLIKIRLEMSREFVRTDGLQGIEKKLDLLFEKLDGKANRADCPVRGHAP